MNTIEIHTSPQPSLRGSDYNETISSNVNDRGNPKRQSRASSSLPLFLFVWMILIGQVGLAQWQPNDPSQSGNIFYNGGNVGIGASSPGYKLTLQSTSQNVLSVKSSSHSVLDIESGSGLNSYLRFVNNGINKWDIAGETTGNLRVYDYLSGVTRLVVTPSGNVGIGTTAPGFKLDVEGGGFRLKNSATASGSYSTFRVQGPDYTHGLEIDFFGNNNITSDPNWSYGGGAGSASIVNVNAKPLTFGTSNVGRMLIDAAGNVGIGTFSPDAKLAVKGTIHTQEVKVDMIGWSDYVFDADYDLPSLEEVKKYIDQHHHLPEIPSAKEVVENGIMLGEMNKLLVKKIEEMTLYMIEQNKLNQEQSSVIRELESRLKALETKQ